MLASERVDRHATIIAPAFLGEAELDPRRRVLSFAPRHPLLGRPMCRIADCATTARVASRICVSCKRQLTKHELGKHKIVALPSWSRQGSVRGPDPCIVEDCAQEWSLTRSVLCSAHAEQRPYFSGCSRRAVLHPSSGETAEPLALCAVSACTSQNRHHSGLYCEAHQQRLRTYRTHDQDLYEKFWRATEPEICLGVKSACAT
ncbi:hypothetical protein MLPF_2535 [Mycobacterium lepromatosis]|nr:hypothetical protein MLPF_2535 [Mycobacterium lepromatosis]